MGKRGVQPYISFNGNCNEAINFYKDALGGKILYVQRYGDSPMKGMGPDEGIMHCTLRFGETELMACDNPGHDDFPLHVGNNISLSYSSNDPVGAESIFAKMAEGGKITMPMAETFWAERFGMLTDKFGINWMFNCDKPESDHAKATS